MLHGAIFSLFLAVQTPVLPIPDVSGWTEIARTDLEFRTNDYTVAFVGQIVDYQHAERKGDFVRVYLRHAVVLSERARARSGHQGAQIGTDLRYHVAEQNKILERAQQDGEAFAYLFWALYEDERGFEVRLGPMQYWLLNAQGDWSYSVNEKMTVMPLSEPSVDNPFATRIVGLRFVLGTVSHVLRLDPVYMVVPKEQKDGGR